MEISETTGAVSDPSSKITINVTVKFRGRSIPVSLSLESTIKDLKCRLQPLTNVLPRGQKLIFRGKVLVDTVTLCESEVENGAKIMLMATQGLHQGDGPVVKDAKTLPISRKSSGSSRIIGEKLKAVDKNSFERWKNTGVIALATCNLEAIPVEVWACGPSARVLDISGNYIQSVPAQISSLSSIQKLFLSENGLLDDSICWVGLASLKQLTVLSLSQNNLTNLPSELGGLTSLRQLHVENNQLASLPDEIGHLTKLELLNAKSNRISSITMYIGSCNSLLEVDLSSNLLLDLPETFGGLRNLKALRLSNNGLKSLPSTLFKMCTQLSTLDLHNTEITMDFLRQFEGWEDFDERRRLKHQKQLDFRVVGSAEFDEGADKY